MADQPEVILLEHALREEFQKFCQEKSLGTGLAMRLLLDGFHENERRIEELISHYEPYKERHITAFQIGDEISDGIYLIDANGVVLEVNRIFCNLTGLKEEEIVGQPVQRLIDRGYLYKAISLQALREGERTAGMNAMLRTQRKVLSTSIPMLDDDGSPLQVLTVMRDLTEIDRLREDLDRVEEDRSRYLLELEYLRNLAMADTEIIGSHPSIQALIQLLRQVADVDSTVLITGETGTGKEVVARELHRISHRREGPYIKVNCAAIPDNLLESELFGYAKGAFTGADKGGKAGMFELAEGGTILLDEIGEMPIGLQAKLLRVLQEREVRRVGSATSIAVDVRVVASTNRDLAAQVKEGTFRQDLFYRLNVVPLDVPPLRERATDIPLLAAYFLERYNEKYKKRKTFDRSVMRSLSSYPFPGNVRELVNMVERLVVTAPQDLVGLEDFRAIVEVEGSGEILVGAGLKLKEAVGQLEKKLISEALSIHGSTHKAAKALGVSQPTVLRKAHQYGLDW